jgi:hypothetical protein
MVGYIKFKEYLYMTNDVIPVVQLQNAVFASDTHWQLDGWEKFASCAADTLSRHLHQFK